MKRRFSNWLIMLLALVAVTGFCFTPVLADDSGLPPDLPFDQEEEIMPPEPQDEMFGRNYQFTWIPAADFTAWVKTTTYFFWDFYGALDGFGWATASIKLPNGAFLKSASMYFYDNSPENLTFSYRRVFGESGSTVPCAVSTSGVTGYGVKTCTLNRTINNKEDINYAQINFSGAGGANLRFKGVRLLWKRQISPAPTSASFTDVGKDHWAFRYVEALKESGITESCSEGAHLYCPDKPVSRAAMATFLARALGLHWPN